MTTTRVAIVGATGAVGREMLNDLEASCLQAIELSLFASPRSSGARLPFRGKTLEVKAFSVEALKGVRYVLMSAGGAFSKEFAMALVAQGATVIDNSSAWRMDATVPLIVPEVNPDALARATGPGIIANPNCSTIQMVVALKPLKDAFGLDMVQVATYQSVSGTGQKGISELSSQVEAHFRFQEPEPKVYAQPIAFNLLPAIDVLTADGHCNEELKMVNETRKILSMPQLAILATTVRVPTFNCHGEAITVRLGEAVTRQQAVDAMRAGEGLVLVQEDEHSKFPTPRGIAGDPRVFVSRLRLMAGETRSPWLQFWNIADNLKKGAASNAVQILERISQ